MGDAVTRTAFYPSMVMHFQLRFDETLQVAKSKDDLDRAAASGELVASRRAGSLPGLIPTAKDAKSATAGRFLEPLVMPGGRFSPLLNRVPHRANVELPGPRQAGKFNARMSWRELPVDPKYIRAARVEIHLGCVPASSFGEGMRGLHDVSGRSRSILQTRLEGGIPNPDTLVFYGLVDSWTVDHDDKGSWINMDGRDLRGILFDGKIPTAKVAKIKLDDVPIGEVVQNLLNTAPFELGVHLRVITDFPDGEPTLGKDVWSRIRQGKEGGDPNSQPTGGGGGGGGDKIPYWDLITKWCFLVGAIPYLVGTSIIIKPARDVFDVLRAREDRSIPSPFRGGKPREVEVGNGKVEQINIRRLVYGRDISRLTYERKYGGPVVPIIEVVATDDKARGKAKRIVVQYPPEGSEAAQLKGDDNKITIPVAGITSKDRLLAIAEDVYEEIGHGEIGGSCETSRLASFGGDNTDPDILRLRPTFPVEFLVDTRALSSRAPMVSQLHEDSRKSYDELVEEFTKRVGDENLARVLVATARSAIVDQLRYYRVANVKFDFDGDHGVKTSFDFQNYIVARHGSSSAKDNRPRIRKVRKVETKGLQAENPVTPVAKQKEAARTGAPLAPLGADERIWYQDGKRISYTSKDDFRAKLRTAGFSDAQITEAIHQSYGWGS